MFEKTALKCRVAECRLRWSTKHLGFNPQRLNGPESGPNQSSECSVSTVNSYECMIWPRICKLDCGRKAGHAEYIGE